MIETTKIKSDCIWSAPIKVRKGDIIVVTDHTGAELRRFNACSADEEYHQINILAEDGAYIGYHIERPRDRDAELDFAVAEIADKLHCLSCPHSRECGVQGTRYGENCINAIKQHIIESAQKTKP